MKLRIHQNSLRFRVTRTELEMLKRNGFIEHSVHFPGSSALIYRLEIRVDGVLGAELCDSKVTVFLPESMARLWYPDDSVSTGGAVTLGDSNTLDLLIEKDFTCLIPREGENQEDYFPNPTSS